MLLPLIGKTVVKMVDNLPVSGEVEIDVSQWFENVTEDAITMTAFGRSYDEGQRVFKLQTQHMLFAAEAFRNVFIPGYRYYLLFVILINIENLVILCQLVMQLHLLHELL